VSVLKTRIIFGIALLSFAIGMLTLDHKTSASFGFGVLATIGLFFGMREIHRMLETIAPIPWKLPAQVAAVALVGAHLAQQERALAPGVPLDVIVIVGFLVAFLGGMLWRLPTREVLLGIALQTFAAAYILGLGTFVLRVRYLPEIGPAALLYLILASKGTDMFAFFTGRFLGKTKLIPWISPGKTVAGFVGGLLGAVGISLAFVRWSPLSGVFGWAGAVPMGIIIGLSSVVGDLVESLIKRGAAVKDSGGLVPEFGGVLDIIDCILYVAPILYLAMTILR
jgi:phosphatidate cytidylyltransferase